MYEVFIENKSLIISESPSESKNHIDLIFDTTKNKWEKTLRDDFFKNILKSNIYIQAKKPKKIFNLLFKEYKIINAGGGIVEWKNRFLFIKRNGLWDIPKGKCEKKESIEETSIREVEEECNIDKISIEYKICTTFHTYKLNKKKILKKTYWYKMNHIGNGETKPQLNEDITECKWFKKDEIDEIKKSTYLSIKHVLSKSNL